MNKQIFTNPQTIKNVFINSNDTVLEHEGYYSIPIYQRAYKWEYGKHCDKLWSDLIQFSENEGKTKEDRYFLGSIIINKENDTNRFNLIDGQQRITTFFLLLKALLFRIDSILKTPFGEDTQTLKINLTNRKTALLQMIYKIDEDTASSIVLGEPKYDELKIKYENNSFNEIFKEDIVNILRANTFEEIKVHKEPRKKSLNKYSTFYKNFLFFYEQIKELESNAVCEFAKTFLDQCEIIIIISYDKEQAIDIFNSLNSTGLPLSDADVISSELYKKYKNKEEFKARWQKIINVCKILEENGILSLSDAFNQYMYILRAKEKNKSATLPSVRTFFLYENKKILENPEEVISDLEKIISFWKNDFFDNQEKKFEERNNLLCILNKLNNNYKLFYTNFLFYRYNDLEGQIEFLKNLIRIFAILEVSEKTYSSAFCKGFLFGINVDIADESVDSKNINEKFKEQIYKEFKMDPKESLNEQTISDGGLYWNQYLKFSESIKENDVKEGIIYLNDFLFAKENDQSINLKVEKIQIEHIMPQSGKNKEGIRINANLSKEEFNDFVNQIGNKILLEQNINGSVSDRWFSIKKNSSVKDKLGYIDSMFPLATSLSNYYKDKWEKEDIEKATKKATSRIIKFLFE